MEAGEKEPWAPACPWRHACEGVRLTVTCCFRIYVFEVATAVVEEVAAVRAADCVLMVECVQLVDSVLMADCVLKADCVRGADRTMRSRGLFACRLLVTRECRQRV